MFLFQRKKSFYQRRSSFGCHFISLIIVNWVDIEKSAGITSEFVSAPNKLLLTLTAQSGASEKIMELPEAFKAKALSELREDDIRKRQALEQFREWIGKQGHIDNCRMGSMSAWACIDALS